jgi:hypothetical protein
MGTKLTYVVRKRVDVTKIEWICVVSGWHGGTNFFVVGDIPGLPIIMFVGIHVERAHVNRRYEKLTEMLTRTGRINVYCTDMQHFIICYERPKSQTEVDICAYIFQVRIQKFMSLILGFYLLNIAVSLLLMI